MLEVLEVWKVEHCLLFGSFEEIQSHPSRKWVAKSNLENANRMFWTRIVEVKPCKVKPFHIPLYWKYNWNHSHVKRFQAAIRVRPGKGSKKNTLQIKLYEIVSLRFAKQNLKPSCRNGGIFPFDHLSQHLIFLLQSFVQLLLGLQLRRLGRWDRRALLGRLRIAVAVAHQKAQALLPGIQILKKMGANQWWDDEFQQPMRKKQYEHWHTCNQVGKQLYHLLSY